MTNEMLPTWGCVGMGSVWGCLLAQALWQAWPSVRATVWLCAASAVTVLVAAHGSGDGWRGALVTGASAAGAAVCLALGFAVIARRHAQGRSRG